MRNLCCLSPLHIETKYRHTKLTLFSLKYGFGEEEVEEEEEKKEYKGRGANGRGKVCNASLISASEKHISHPVLFLPQFITYHCFVMSLLSHIQMHNLPYGICWGCTKSSVLAALIRHARSTLHWLSVGTKHWWYLVNPSIHFLRLDPHLGRGGVGAYLQARGRVHSEADTEEAGCTLDSGHQRGHWTVLPLPTRSVVSAGDCRSREGARLSKLVVCWENLLQNKKWKPWQKVWMWQVGARTGWTKIVGQHCNCIPKPTNDKKKMFSHFMLSAPNMAR